MSTNRYSHAQRAFVIQHEEAITDHPNLFRKLATAPREAGTPAPEVTKAQETELADVPR